MAGERERECEALVREAWKRPVGFEPPAPVSKRTVKVNPRWLVEKVMRVADAREARKTAAAVRRAPVRKGAVRTLNAERLEFEGAADGSVLDAVDRELARRRPAAARKSGGSAAPVDLGGMWRGGDDGATLRKSASESAVAGPDGEALTLIKAAHAGGGIVEATGERRRDLEKRAVAAGLRRPTWALTDAYDRADALALAKTAGAEISPARIAESEQMVSALAQMPAPRAAFTAPPDWTDDARLVAAEAGAAELQAAAVEAAHGSTAWLDRLNMTALAKDFARNRRRMPLGNEPPRVKS